MSPQQHRDKAERIERSISILEDHDWEIRIEAAMLAGTHWANHVLHLRGLSMNSEDIIHTTMCAVNVLRKYELAEKPLLDYLADIEELRPLHVRGDVDGGPAAGRRALQMLALIRERALAVALAAEGVR